MSYALAGTAVVGGIEAGIGAIGSHKTKERAAKLAASRPKAQITPESNEEVQLASSELANNGHNPGQFNEDDKDLSTSLDTILKGGGDPNSVSAMFSDDQGGRQRMALISEQMRLAKTNNLVSALRNRAGEREEDFKNNEIAPWDDAAQANAQARSQSQSLIWGGINTAASAAMAYGTNAMKTTPTPKTTPDPFANTRTTAATASPDLPVPGYSNDNPSKYNWQSPQVSSIENLPKPRPLSSLSGNGTLYNS